MRALGGKISGRRLMQEAGVPVVPGADNISIDDVATAKREAERIGFPLLVKASAGGGGRGIRLVQRAEDLENAMRASGSEASSSFGDATIFLEKYVSPARHIEVQMIADAHGNVRAFGERECSIQRRNQKLVEEAPSVAVTPEIRKRLCDAAVAAAKSCGYRNAGTVEFLMDREGNFYFLEVNARLQVEHPVTELVYGGVDLVALQLRVAAGEVLPDLDAPWSRLAGRSSAASTARTRTRTSPPQWASSTTSRCPPAPASASTRCSSRALMSPSITTPCSGS